jgi:hypothetical protein
MKTELGICTGGGGIYRRQTRLKFWNGQGKPKFGSERRRTKTGREGEEGVGAEAKAAQSQFIRNRLMDSLADSKGIAAVGTLPKEHLTTTPV